jgi:FimV-like protein
VQAKVEDKKQPTPAPDKLTLSKGSVEGKSSEANIASQLAAKDSAARAAEIAKNISDLNKLTVTSNQATPPPELPASNPASASSTPGLVVGSMPKPSAPTADTPAVKSSAAHAQKSSHSWFDGLLKNPYAPVGALGLMAALVGFGVFRYRQRNKVQSSILGDPLDSLEPEAPADTAPAQTLSLYPEASESDLAPVEAVAAEQHLDLDLNLDLDAETSDEPVPQRAEPIALNEAIDIALPDLDIFATPEATSTETKVVDLKPKVLPPSSAPIAASTPDSNALDFDLGAVSLDLEQPKPEPESEPPEIIGDGQDPLETKLALAHEFSAIGDEHGARALIEEVIAEATGAMKTKAERALSQLQLG